MPRKDYNKPKKLQVASPMSPWLEKLFPHQGYGEFYKNTPRVGFEPTTNRLTADRSTTELPRIGGTVTNYNIKTLLLAIP